MAKGYVNRNYLQREGNFPDYVLSMLTTCIAHYPSVRNHITMSSPQILLFHCCISGRTGCLSATPWTLIAENFTLAQNFPYSIRTEVSEGISWNRNLPYIFIALDVYTGIWEEAVQWMGGWTLLLKHSRKGFGLHCILYLVTDSDYSFPRKQVSVLERY